MGERVAIGRLGTPVGELRVAATPNGVIRVAFPGGSGSFSGWLKGKLPDHERVDGLGVLDQALEELSAYFDGARREFKLPLDLRGTSFQRSVWDALLEIPFGQTRSYADVARAVGRPRAFRAVGMANSMNPVPVVVPCHRVIAADGSLGGFSAGLETKRRLLAFEQALAHDDRLL